MKLSTYLINEFDLKAPSTEDIEVTIPNQVKELRHEEPSEFIKSCQKVLWSPSGIASHEHNLKRAAHHAVLTEYLMKNKLKSAFESLDTIFKLPKTTNPQELLVGLCKILEDYFCDSNIGASFDSLNFAEITKAFKNAIQGSVHGVMRTILIIVSFLKNDLNYENLKRYASAGNNFMKEFLALPNPLSPLVYVGYLGIQHSYDIASVQHNKLTIRENEIDLNDAQRQSCIDEVTHYINSDRGFRNRINIIKNLPILGCPTQFTEIELPIKTRDNMTELKKVNLADALYMLTIDAFSLVMFGKRIYGAEGKL